MRTRYEYIGPPLSHVQLMKSINLYVIFKAFSEHTSDCKCSFMLIQSRMLHDVTFATANWLQVVQQQKWETVLWLQSLFLSLQNCPAELWICVYSSKWAPSHYNSQTGSGSASDVPQNCWELKERGDCSVPLLFSLTLMHYLPFYLPSICFAVLTSFFFFFFF